MKIVSYNRLCALPGLGGLVRYALGEVVDHGDADHAFRTCLQLFIVSGEPTVKHEPAKTSLDYPAPFHYFEAAGLGVARDDFDVDS